MAAVAGKEEPGNDDDERTHDREPEDEEPGRSPVPEHVREVVPEPVLEVVHEREEPGCSERARIPIAAASRTTRRYALASCGSAGIAAPPADPQRSPDPRETQ